MKRVKIIFFPIGSHDAAGNKRLKNLSKYLELNEKVDVYYFIPYSDKFRKRSGISLYVIKFGSLIIDVFRTIYVLLREKKKGYINYLYFYEGRHLMFHRIIAAKILGYKILIDLVENPNPLSYTKSLTQKARATYFLGMYKIIPFYASGIIVVTKYLKNKIESDFNKRVPAFLLTVTFDSDDFNIMADTLNYPTIFYGGSYGNNYDFDSLFNAFNNIGSEFPELKLVLSGNIEKSMAKRINERIIKKENIIFLGFLSEDKYYKTICSMTILCMPRNNSVHSNAGFPFKLAEYLATGKPVITSRVSDVSDYLMDDEAYIYEPSDSRKIESFIRYILNNPEVAYYTGLRGKRKANICFAADTVANKCFQFISDLK